MDDDMIYRQAAINALERKKDKNAKGDVGGFYNTIIQNDIDAIMQLPSAQPEIIRCRDCAWHNIKINQCNRQICAVMYEDDFCSHAERRTDDT